MIVLILVEAMFITLSVLFFMGKGKNLIAGYNTMSKEEKEKYDEKKLCKSMGFMSLICAVMTGVMAVFGYLVEKGIFKEKSSNAYICIPCDACKNEAYLKQYCRNNKYEGQYLMYHFFGRRIKGKL